MSNDHHGNGASYHHCTDGTDEREEDPADGPQGVNADGDGSPDDEPSIGWTDEEVPRGRTFAGSYGNTADFELCSTPDLAAAQARYRCSKIDGDAAAASRSSGVTARSGAFGISATREILKPRSTAERSAFEGGGRCDQTRRLGPAGLFRPSSNFSVSPNRILAIGKGAASICGYSTIAVMMGCTTLNWP